MQGLRDTNGEVVEGHGGRIMRSTARKDRHSKINTAKGPRDRRVRLSAHTAIQFYDVQDRLGYDQPSKAVDWLIEKAKASIDALAESPSHNNFTATVTTTDITSPGEKEHELGEEYNQMDVQGGVDYDFEKIQYLNGGGGGPITTSSISSHFQSYPPPDFDSRTVSHTQNFLPSSFKSLQDQNLLCFSSSPAYCFDKGVPDLGQLHRMSDWSPYSNVRNGEGTGVDFDSSEPVFGQSQSFSNRGTLQSNNMPSVCSPPMNVPPATANPPHQIMALNPSSVPNYEINSDKFYGFPFLA